MTLWITSDTHFGHHALIGGEESQSKSTRDFRSVCEMNECIADNWNSCVRPEDTVYHLGDVYVAEGWRMLAKLKGRKNLILGNHDNPLDPHLSKAFSHIALWKAFDASKLVLTHLPIDLSEESGLGVRFNFNVHGHLHHRPAPTPKHLCASVEQTNYTPVNLEDMIMALSE